MTTKTSDSASNEGGLKKLSIHQKLKAQAEKHKLGNPTGEREILVPLSKLQFDPTQPRKAYHTLDGRIAEKDEQYIAELAKSIQESELIQAITVRETGDGNYVVVVGECRTRAHIKLGLPTIRAIVRNDLVNPALRLLYQLSENVNRNDLTDDELAISIRHLLAGDKENGVPALSQVQIAEKLGKSEGWVSRFVKYGDEELHRVWKLSGIVDTVENLYRIQLLPKPMQVDIRRRVDLPEDHPEYLEKPLSRKQIDEFTLEAKQNKRNAAQVAVAPANDIPPVNPAATIGAGTAPVAQENKVAPEGGKGGNSDDSIARALEQAALDAEKNQALGKSALPGAQSESGNGKYQLSSQAREALVGAAAKQTQDDAGGGRKREEAKPPVNCRVSVRNLEMLMSRFEDEEELMDLMRSVRVEMNLPGELGKKVASKLAGIVIDDQEVPAILQVELAKLV